MSEVHQNVGAAVRKARDKAKEVLQTLESQGHPQTVQSSSLYLALVSLQKRLLAVDPPPAPIASFVAELQQLVGECQEKLEPVKLLIEEAMRAARATSR